MPHGMHIKKMQDMKKGANVFMFKSDVMMEVEEGFEIEIDTIQSEGEQQIKVSVITDKEE